MASRRRGASPTTWRQRTLATELRAVGRRTRETLLAHGLDERARTGGRFSENPPTLEWICFHVLAEYARHAGHFDVVRELGAVSS